MISVIIPVYNAGEYLKRMLDCVERQSYQDMEVIIVDDGSTDSSGIICDSVAKRDSRFYVVHQKNGGVSVARNNGIKFANGEFITFLDADDEIPSNYIETLVNTQQKTQADIVVCDVVMLQDKEAISRFSNKDAVLNNVQALNLLLSRKKINPGPCAKLIKSNIIGFSCFPLLKTYEDVLFIKDVFDKANRIAVTGQTEYRYIQNDNSAMHQIANIPSEDVIVATKELVMYIEMHKDLSPMCMYITLSHLFQYVKPIIKSQNLDEQLFVNKTRRFYRNHLKNILKCNVFPWKEKVLLYCLALE